MGELGLDGTLRAVPGVLPIAVAARERGIANLIVPERNAREAAVVEGVNVYPVRTLTEVRALLNANALNAEPFRAKLAASSRSETYVSRWTSRMFAGSRQPSVR